MTAPTAQAFDEWYEAIAVSPGWDDFVCRALSLPAEVESSGYLTGPGLHEVQERLALRPGETLVELGCGRAGYGLACIAASGARLVGVDVSAVALDAAGRAAERQGAVDRLHFSLLTWPTPVYPTAVLTRSWSLTTSTSRSLFRLRRLR